MRTYTRSEVAEAIVGGSNLFIYHNLVISPSRRWLSMHPGGELAILHFVGRDATDEVEAYHPEQTLKRIEGMAVGRVQIDGAEGKVEDTESLKRVTWKPLTPPIALGLVRHPDGVKGHWAREGNVRLGQEISSRARSEEPEEKSTSAPAQSNTASLSSKIEVITLAVKDLEPASVCPNDVDPVVELERSKAYHDLRSKIADAGLFEAPGPLAGYGSDILRYILLGGMAFGLHLKTNSWLGQMASAVFLGLFYHQLTFLAHDAGHSGVTGNYFKDRIIGTLVADWIGGLSLGWWCDNHNIHHLVTNHPEHDPDIQHIPFFAITKDFLSGLWSTYYKRVMAMDAFAKTMIQIQHKLYFVVLSLARFNLYANSYSFLLLKAKRNRLFYFEISGIIFFWTYFLSMLRSLPSTRMRIAYLLVSHIVTSPVHVQITLSHFACSTVDLGPMESFPSRQLRTTMDVICSPLIEFVHGGLHLQVTHHLFPRLPRHNLRKASLLVKKYCAEQGVVYREHGFVEGNAQVLHVLKDVANQLQLLKQVAEAESLVNLSAGAQH